MLNELLKKYDKQLRCKRNIDGTISIFRKSTYSSMKFNVLEIENQYLGSCKWLLRKIALMDSTRKDFITSSILNNQRIRQGKKDDRISREVADFINNGGMTVVF
jgi:hypothetical protein